MLMKAKNINNEQEQSIIASIVIGALKNHKRRHKRHKTHNAIYSYIKTRTEPKVGAVLGEALWATIKGFIDSNVVTSK